MTHWSSYQPPRCLSAVQDAAAIPSVAFKTPHLLPQPPPPAFATSDSPISYWYRHLPTPCHPAYSCLCVVLTFDSYLLSVGKLPLQTFSCGFKPRTPLLSPIQALCGEHFLGRCVLVITISLDDCIPFDIALGIWSFSLIPSSFSWLQISEVPSTLLRKPWCAFHC